MEECQFSPATLLKLTLLHGCFSRFLNCTNGTKSCNASHMTSSSKFYSRAEVLAPVLGSYDEDSF